MQRHAGDGHEPSGAALPPEPAAGAGEHLARGGDPLPPSFAPQRPADRVPPPSAGRSFLAWIRETAVVLISALVLSWLVKTFLVQAFYIPSISMNDTFQVNDRILVSKLTPGPFTLHRGDIVVFTDPGGWLGATGTTTDDENGLLHEVATWVGLLPTSSDEHLVKRVIGLPGDHVACAGAGEPVTVNGVAIDETYLKAGSIPSEVAFDQVVPEGSLWVMGDNRQNSADSRYNLGSAGGGFVPLHDVVGVAFVTVWPLARADVLTNPSDVFAQVPAP